MNRQDYKDVTVAEASATNCDIFQIKYDGIWARIEIEDSVAEVYSRSGKIKKTFHIPNAPDCILIGEYMVSSQRSMTHENRGGFHIFDCVKLGATAIASKPYAERYQIASVVVNNLPPQFRRVRSFSSAGAQQAWEVLRNRGEEGIVFRCSRDTYGATLLRAKYEVEKTYYAVDFHAGMGKHSHHLGAISVSDSPRGEVVMKVGGGFTDGMRSDIWRDMDYYRRQPLVVKGHGEFNSGALRHPNFVRWE